MPVHKKDPSDFLDYKHDWAEFLGEDTIVNSVWEGPAELTLDQPSFTATTATIWIGGGEPEGVYEVVNRVTTAGGRVAERSKTIAVMNL